MSELSPTKETPPVLMVIFNRQDNARRVFDAVRQAKPKQLFIAADGPRPDRIGEKERCDQTRKIAQEVDWPCEVHTDFLDKNIGPCLRVPMAISWFFDHVEQGIILEDDCLPDQSFFSFCGEMLERYKNDEKVMNISGNNFQDGIKRGDSSYYFSRYPSTWGWATWRRAWKLYDTNMSRFPAFIKEKRIKSIVPDKDKGEQRYWLTFFTKEHAGKFIFWDVKWLFTIWSYGAVSVIPNNNLVTNIGFGADATHTKGELGLSIPLKPLTRIIHPKEIVVDHEADRYLYQKVYRTTVWSKIKYKLRQLFG